jgi:hypothetical protein
MAKPNYQFQKRQKELEKKKKNEEKQQRKLANKNLPSDDTIEESPAEDENA